MRRVVIAVAVVAAALIAIGVVLSGGSGAAQQSGIAYVRGMDQSNAKVWFAGAQGGGAHVIGPGTNPRLSPSGRLIAASSPSDQGQALILYDTSGGVVGRFFNAAAQTAVAQAWSADSRYLAVVLSSTDPASNANSALALIDTHSESARVLARGTVYGASFAPDASNRIVYARAATGALSARVNIHVISPDGSGDTAITRDGRSLYPIWGRLGIVFDRERLRRHADPQYELFLMSQDGTHVVRITSLRVPALLDGLVPVAVSDDGAKLLAEYVGAETSQGWTVDLSTHAVHRLFRAGHTVVGAGISHGGSEVLIDRAGFLNPPERGIVEQLPFSGPGGTMLIPHGSDPSWNL